MIVLLTARVGFLMMNAKGNALSFAWAESNFFGLPAVFTKFCGICLFVWTKNCFIEAFSEKLEKLRMLRLEKNIELDNYRNIHIVAIILSVLWLVAMMSWIVFNFTHNKIFYGGEETELILCALLIVSNVYIWFISTICLACYSLIFSALNREIIYFNDELKKSKEKKVLQNIEVLEKFDHRQNEILNLNLFVNESVSFFGGLVPLFLFYGLVNGVYLTVFVDSIPPLYFAILMLNLASIVVYNLCILSPTSLLQEHLSNTTKILINDEEFGCSKDPFSYQTYRIMVDRFQKIDTKIYVISAFPITKRVVAASLFILPNMGFLLVLIHKVLITNGGHV